MESQTLAVKNYMIPFSDYPSLNHNHTILDAVNIMTQKAKEKGFRWIVILDNNNNIIGFLTLRALYDAINKLGSEAGNRMGVFGYAPHDTFFWEGVQSIKNTPLKKCIRPIIKVYVHENDYPARAAHIILSQRITIVPIVNDQQEIVGIVRPVDLLPFIKTLLENSPK